MACSNSKDYSEFCYTNLFHDRVNSLTHVRWVLYHHGMARPQVADGGDALRVAANTGCFKKSFTTLKAYINLYRGHTQRFELS
jgi:hypothetical protein